jgi:glycosyltransferase involved in cell wall biosynthesis
MKQITPIRLVTVVIPCYNSSATIKNCLESVLKQSYQNIEIVLIDDGSTDDTLPKLRELKNKHQDRYSISVVTQKNAGPSKARNNGVELAQGELIAFLDSDDIWIPEKLSLQIELYNRFTQPPVMIGAPHPYNKSKIVAGYTEITLKKLLWSNFFQTSSVLSQRKILMDNKFNENQKYSEDYALWLTLAKRGKCLLIHQPLTESSKRSFNGKGLSSKKWQMEKWELINYYNIYKTGDIKWSEYYFFTFYSFLKFLRRVALTLM